MSENKLILKPFQSDFFMSQARFPALIAGIGTGKTMVMLLKIFQYCQSYANSLALVVRKEFTDLRDSTMRDFERYFGCIIPSDKNYKMANGSEIMFRHGAELDVLKNLNLSIVGIEQAEEFPTDETFHFLRDRLRREGAPYRQMCLIANANGHNWIWRLWVNNPPSADYFAVTANTFENEDNLPEDFIEDLKRMEKDAPNHYAQYVLNSFDQVEDDDYLLTTAELTAAAALDLLPRKQLEPDIVLACDVARFGQDLTVFTAIRRIGQLQWEQIHQEAHQGKDLMWTTGRFISLRRDFHSRINVADGCGVGGGLVDRLRETGVNVIDFNSANKASDEDLYNNRRSEGYFRLREQITRGYLKILNDFNLHDQLLTIRYKYNSKGQRAILSKDDLRKEGIKSPDLADALMMAVSCAPKVSRGQAAPVIKTGKAY
jgi:hypothetical protein